MLVFSVYFWHSEVWIPRNEALLEAVVKQARATRHPWFQSRHMFIKAPGQIKRSNG